MNEIYFKIKESGITFPTETCLCGFTGSFRKHINDLKLFYGSDTVYIDGDCIKIFTFQYDKVRYYYHTGCGDIGLWEVIIDNPFPSFIIVGDITCCGSPTCLVELCNIITKSIGVSVYWYCDKLYTVHNGYVCDLPRLKYCKFVV